MKKKLFKFITALNLYLLFIISLTASLCFSVDNNLPISIPGGPYTIDIGDTLALDGSGSYDPDSEIGDFIVQYEWDLNGDGTYDIIGSESPRITWETLSTLLTEGIQYPTSPLTYQPYISIGLRVTDSFDATSISYTTLKVYNTNPTAFMDITPNPCAVGQPVNFSGSGSYAGNPQHTIAAWTWRFYQDGSLITTIAGENINYTFQNPGAYEVNLTVTDSGGYTGSIVGTVVINNPPNHSPEALAGGPYIIDIGDTLNLDGSGSYDSDYEIGDFIVQYEWDLNGDGVYDVIGSESPRVYWQTLSTLLAQGVQYPTPAFSAPNILISLRVTDSFGATNIGYTYLGVYNPNPTALMDITPNPGIIGQPVNFSGSGSYAGNPQHTIAAWTWRFYQDGSLITTIAGENINYTFQDAGVYEVNLIVTDSESRTNSITETMAIDVPLEHHPVAHPGGPYTIFIGNTLILDGSNSYDPDAEDQIVSYEWDINNDGTYDYSTGNSQLQIDWLSLTSILDPQNYPADSVTGEPCITIKLRVTDLTALSSTAQSKLRIYSDLPTAIAVIFPEPAIAGNLAYLDSSGSYGCRLLSSQIVSWTWKIYKDSILIDTLTGSNVSYIFPEVGQYQVELIVIDDASRTNTVTFTLPVTPGSYKILGDLNNDSKVDFADFAIMSENWLIDCVQEASNPACTLR